MNNDSRHGSVAPPLTRRAANPQTFPAESQPASKVKRKPVGPPKHRPAKKPKATEQVVEPGLQNGENIGPGNVTFDAFGGTVFGSQEQDPPPPSRVTNSTCL